MPKVKAKKSSKGPARSSAARPRASGGSHHPAEVALAWLVKRTPQASELLAKVLGKTPGAVELLWRWCDGSEAPPSAHPRVQEQVARVREVLGGSLRGQFSLEPSPSPAVPPPVSQAPEAHRPVLCREVSNDPLCHMDSELVSDSLRPF
jgi:hypothetical protein